MIEEDAKPSHPAPAHGREPAREGRQARDGPEIGTDKQ